MNCPLLWVLLHGLRARELEALNVGDFDGHRVNIREAKDDSVGQVPLLPEAVETLEVYLNFRSCWGEVVEPESPLFLSVSNNSKGDRLGYSGIYNAVKDLAACGREGCTSAPGTAHSSNRDGQSRDGSIVGAADHAA